MLLLGSPAHRGRWPALGGGKGAVASGCGPGAPDHRRPKERQRRRRRYTPNASIAPPNWPVQLRARRLTILPLEARSAVCGWLAEARRAQRLWILTRGVPVASSLPLTISR